MSWAERVQCFSVVGWSRCQKVVEVLTTILDAHLLLNGTLAKYPSEN